MLKLSSRLKAYRKNSDLDQERVLGEAHRECLCRCNTLVSIDCLSCLLSTNEWPITSGSPLFEYAARNWVNHVKMISSVGSIPDEVFQPMLSLFDKDHRVAFQNWLLISNPEYEHVTLQEKEVTINPEPLYYAIFLELSPLIEAVFAQEVADMNSGGGLYGSCLQLAGFLGNVNIVKELISRGTKVDALGEIFGSTLRAATAGGHSEIVSLLLSNPLVDPNISGGLPGNSLQAALARNSNEIVSLLVAHGASFNPNGGRLWKSAYNGLKRWQKSRLYSFAKSTVTLPQLTGRQTRLAHIMRLNSEPVQLGGRVSR